MENQDLAIEKEKEYRGNISRLNYYIVGFDAGGLYLLLQKAEVLKAQGLANFLYWLWAVGALAFLCGVVWLYLLSKYVAWELRYHHHLSCLKGFGDASFGQDLREQRAREHCLLAEEKMKRLWPSGFREAFFSTLVWNVFQWGSKVFILGLLGVGFGYLLRI